MTSVEDQRLKMRALARDLFQRTLERLDIPRVLRARVQAEGEILQVDAKQYDLADFDRVILVAVGKAASSVCDGLWPLLASCLKRGQEVAVIVVGPERPRAEVPNLVYIPGSHPFPDHRANEAAVAILDRLRDADERTLVFHLISGGASAMLERPLDPAISVEEVTGFYRALVHSGLPIREMNTLRKHFSLVKGGRLAVAAAPATQCSLLISDVPGDMTDVIGSGPSLPDPSSVEDCHEILRRAKNALGLSPRVAEFFATGLPETPKVTDPIFRACSWSTLLSSVDLSETACALAAEADFHPIVDNRCDDWEYREAASYLLGRLKEEAERHKRVCLISVGELSVHLPRAHGLGGRNQQFALECARLLAGRTMDVTVVSGGSDGIDGNSEAAGAVADGETLQRAYDMGLDALAELDRFNSNAVFQKLGDAMVTGPSGNNLRDLRMLFAAR